MAVNPLMEGARSAGINGMHAAQKGLDNAAQEVAELNAARASKDADASRERADSARDPAEAVAQIKLYQRQVQASARVVETADAVVGFLLDVHA